MPLSVLRMNWLPTEPETISDQQPGSRHLDRKKAEKKRALIAETEVRKEAKYAEEGVICVRTRSLSSPYSHTTLTAGVHQDANQKQEYPLFLD